jgi:hypothetical protein
MFFRMEPDRRRASPNLDDFCVREPWPVDLTGMRLYNFGENGGTKICLPGKGAHHESGRPGHLVVRDTETLCPSDRWQTAELPYN